MKAFFDSCLRFVAQSRPAKVILVSALFLLALYVFGLLGTVARFALWVTALVMLSVFTFCSVQLRKLNRANGLASVDGKSQRRRIFKRAISSIVTFGFSALGLFWLSSPVDMPKLDAQEKPQGPPEVLKEFQNRDLNAIHLSPPAFPKDRELLRLLEKALDREESNAIRSTSITETWGIVGLSNGSDFFLPWWVWIGDDPTDDWFVRKSCKQLLEKLLKQASLPTDEIDPNADCNQILQQLLKLRIRNQTRPKEALQPTVLADLSDEKQRRFLDAVADLKDALPDRRERAILTLTGLGRIPNSVIPDLMTALDDSSPIVRQKSANALAAFGAHLTEKQANLVLMAATQSRISFKQAMQVLERYGDPQFFVSLLNDRNAQVRLQVLIQLWERRDLPPSQKSLPALIALLQDESSTIVGYAMKIIGRYGDDAKIAVPALIALARRGSNAHRSEIWNTFASIGPGASDGVPLIGDAIRRGGSYNDFRSAVQAVTRLGPNAAGAVPALIADLEKATPQPNGISYPEETIDALASIGPAASKAVPLVDRVLREFISSSGTTADLNRTFVARNLAALGDDGLHALFAATKSDRPTIRMNAAKGIGKYGRSRLCVTEAIKMMSTAKAEERFIGSQILLYISWYDRSLLLPNLKELIAAVRDEDYRVRLNSIRCIELIGKNAADAEVALQDAMNDAKSRDVRDAAIRTLSRIK